MTRHQFTPEERARGHKLTHADRVKGAIAANRIRGARGGKAAHAKGTAHQLTHADRVRGGLATAAKRKAARVQALVTLALPAKREMGLEWTPGTAGPDSAPIEISPMLPAPMSAAVAQAFGASLADKLMASTFTHHRPEVPKPGAVPVDPFTLSALKRFKYGPKSPLSLTRGQRAQVGLLMEAGLIEPDSESMLRLTSKGREAVEEES